MDIFGFQFAYAPTALSGVGAFAIFAMLIATGGFVFAYLTGVLVSIRAIALRERNRELAKKRKLRDLLAMKAAQDELDVEIAREMHGIRPTSSFVESGELNNIDPEVVPAVLAGSGIAQAVFQTNDTALPVEEAIVSVEANNSSSEAISNEISSETPLAFSEADDNAVSKTTEATNASDTESVLASSPFGSSVPLMAEIESETPLPVAAEVTDSSESASSPFSFFSQTAENQSSESVITEAPAKPEPEISPEPTGESSPFVFSFAAEPQQPEKPSKPTEKPKESAKAEAVPEMSAFFQT